MMDAGEGRTESFEMTEIAKADLAIADNQGYIAEQGEAAQHNWAWQRDFCWDIGDWGSIGIIILNIG